MRVVNCESEIVVDTNALAHAEQAAVSFHPSAFALVRWLSLADDVDWVLDDQGKRAPELSTSVLASEYYATLAPQDFR
jgi:hypothetical protein